MPRTPDEPAHGDRHAWARGPGDRPAWARGAAPVQGPASPPAPPRRGPLWTLRALLGLLPASVVAAEYLLRQVPDLAQDVRSLVNSLAGWAAGVDVAVLGDLVRHLAQATASDGALTQLLRALTDLAETAAVELGGEAQVDPVDVLAAYLASTRTEGGPTRARVSPDR